MEMSDCEKVLEENIIDDMQEPHVNLEHIKPVETEMNLEIPQIPDEVEKTGDSLSSKNIYFSGDTSPGQQLSVTICKVDSGKNSCKTIELESKSNENDSDFIFKRVLKEALKVSNNIKSQMERRNSIQLGMNSNHASTKDVNSSIDDAKEGEGEDSSFNLRSECYYCTKDGKVKGMLTVKSSMMVFDPLECKENDEFKDISKYHCYVDLRDVSESRIIKLPNESAQYIKNQDERNCYIYDYYLEISLLSINGSTMERLMKKRENNLQVPTVSSSKFRSKSIDVDEMCLDSSSLQCRNNSDDSGSNNSITQNSDVNGCNQKSKNDAIAVVFFRFSHRDKDNKSITNREQARIAESIDQNIKNAYENSSPISVSSTFVPYYDSLVDMKSSKSKICSKNDKKPRRQKISDDSFECVVQDESIIEEQINLGKMQISALSSTMPTYKPFVGEKSAIISEMQAIMLSRLLPNIIAMQTWERLHSIDQDGISLATFYNNLKDHSSTLLLIQDSKGFKFGCYASSAWKMNKHFYGTGESFLFTFKDTEEDLSVYKWAGVNYNIQHSDEDAIAMGGFKGNCGIYFRRKFLYGSSHKCETFASDVLSSSEDFECVKFEVWGFDSF